MFVSGSPPNKCSPPKELELRYARICCRSYATRPAALCEQTYASGDTPGSVGRGAGAVWGEQMVVRKFVCFFYFFSLPLYHRSVAVVKCFLENFFKKFLGFLLTCAGVSWYNLYVNEKGKEKLVK